MSMVTDHFLQSVMTSLVCLWLLTPFFPRKAERGAVCAGEGFLPAERHDVTGAHDPRHCLRRHVHRLHPHWQRPQRR